MIKDIITHNGNSCAPTFVPAGNESTRHTQAKRPSVQLAKSNMHCF